MGELEKVESMAFKKTDRIHVRFDKKIDQKGREQYRHIFGTPQARTLLQSIAINEKVWLKSLAFLMRVHRFTHCFIRVRNGRLSCDFQINPYRWIEY